MNILKVFMRLVLKTLLAPVSLLLLLTKGVLCLATKIVELPLGLFIWLMIFIIGFCVFNHLWRDFAIALLIMAAVYALLFAVEFLKAMLDGLMGLIRAI